MKLGDINNGSKSNGKLINNKIAFDINTLNSIYNHNENDDSNNSNNPFNNEIPLSIVIFFICISRFNGKLLSLLL